MIGLSITRFRWSVSPIQSGHQSTKQYAKWRLSPLPTPPLPRSGPRSPCQTGHESLSFTPEFAGLCSHGRASNGVRVFAGFLKRVEQVIIIIRRWNYLNKYAYCTVLLGHDAVRNHVGYYTVDWLLFRVQYLLRARNQRSNHRII